MQSVIKGGNFCVWYGWVLESRDTGGKVLPLFLWDHHLSGCQRRMTEVFRNVFIAENTVVCHGILVANRLFHFFCEIFGKICTARWASRVELVVKNPPANSGNTGDAGLMLGLKVPWRRAWQRTPVFLPGESHGQWSLVGYSP